MTVVFLLVPAALLVLSAVVCVLLVCRGTPAKRAMAFHFLTVMLIAVFSLALPIAANAAVAGADPDAAEAVQDAAGNGFRYIGAGLAVGLAGVGGGIAVAAGAPAAIGANVEDPKSFGKSIIFVALGEGFGLYGLLIGILCLVL